MQHRADLKFTIFLLLLTGCSDRYGDAKRRLTIDEFLQVELAASAWAQERELIFPETLENPWYVRGCGRIPGEGRLDRIGDIFGRSVVFLVCGDSYEEDLAIIRHETFHELFRSWVERPYYRGPAEEYWERIGEARDWFDRTHTDADLWRRTGGIDTIEGRVQ